MRASTSGYTHQALKMAEKLGVILVDGDFRIYNPCKNNRPNTEHYWEIDGKNKRAVDWCREYGVDIEDVKAKMAHGLTVKEAITAVKNGENGYNFYEIDGEKHTLTNWCKMYNVLVPTVKYRLKKGYDLKTALTMDKLQ